MRYTDLVKAIKKQIRNQLSYGTLDLILRACFTIIAKTIENGETVHIPEFGRFETITTNPRVVMSNLESQVRYQVPERKQVRFVPSATWVDQLNDRQDTRGKL